MAAPLKIFESPIELGSIGKRSERSTQIVLITNHAVASLFYSDQSENIQTIFLLARVKQARYGTVVVDHAGYLTFCSAGAVGKTEKQEAFDDSLLRMFASKPKERFPNDSHLVAGPDYELHENVMVPYNDANLTAEQKQFNEHLKLAHNSATKAISVLKARFPSLGAKLEVGKSDLVRIYFIACCVLYNICLEKNDVLDVPPYFVTQEFNSAPPGALSVASAEALQKRDRLCKELHKAVQGVCSV